VGKQEEKESGSPEEGSSSRHTPTVFPERTSSMHTPTCFLEDTSSTQTPTSNKKLPPKKYPTQKPIVKFPCGKIKSPKRNSQKKSYKKSPKKSMIVKIPLAKLKTPVTLVKKTKTLADLKMGLAQKKMGRPMR
jgi:hypothetical protein